MVLSNEIQVFLEKDALKRFLNYIQIDTTANEKSVSFPSSEGQLKLGKLLVNELKALGLKNIVHDDYGYVYAFLPSSKGLEMVKTIGFIAHLDTSPSVSGKNVKPIIHKNYDGSDIIFPKNPEIKLTVEDSPQLNEYIGLDIITSQGDTLLGADDKAGIAEILAACSAWNKYPELKHGPIIFCFFPDEELGKGALKIDEKMIPEICYTIDGSEMGELEIECFDAWKINLVFNGINIHPGYAKNLMINAIHIASRFLSELPETESPEKTEDREGFYHLIDLEGNVEKAEANLIIRDFDIENNKRRMDYINTIKRFYEQRYLGIKIEVKYQHQYENMLKYLEKEKKVVKIAKKAIKAAGLEVKFHSVRGGTDGAHLSSRGIPTPNLFTGGLLFHSKKEYIPTLALQKGAEVIIHLAELWTKL
ncbi:MAG: peptidase T [Promethearchaeota archaeon]